MLGTGMAQLFALALKPITAPGRGVSPLLDTSKSTGIGRAFLLPSSRNNIFAKYVLLRREGIERQHIESEENQPPAKDGEEL